MMFALRLGSRAAACALLIGSMLCLATPAAAVISNVDSADDVCSPAADPCVITETIEVVSGSVLDFGLRHVQLIGAGEIDSDIGSYRMRMGQLTATVAGNRCLRWNSSSFR
jgi:hypothetical protein